MGYSDGAWERAMKIQEVILRALSGENHWFQAAEILGLSVRTMRRYRAGLEKWGYEGLFGTLECPHTSPRLRRFALLKSWRPVSPSPPAAVQT
jgi:hypothetical protein